MMKPDQILFAAVLLMCAAVTLTALLPAESGSIAHPDHPTMRHSGTGIEPDLSPEESTSHHALWVGWLFGVALILFFVALISFGARRHIRDLGRWLVLTTAAVIGAWTWMIYAYRGYLDDPAPALYLALPAPTAVMVYVYWPLTLVFVLFFVLGFRHWVLSDDDFDAYKSLIETSRRRKQSPSQHQGKSC